MVGIDVYVNILEYYHSFKYLSKQKLNHRYICRLFYVINDILSSNDVRVYVCFCTHVCYSDWVGDCLLQWVSGWLSVTVSEWVIVCYSEWVGDCLLQWVSGWLSVTVSEWVIVCYSEWVGDCLLQWVSGWLLLNANSAIFKLYHGVNKLIFNEMIMRSLCSRPRPTLWVGFLSC
jgi:hypothetical protein